MQLYGQVVIITGSARGFGEGFAEAVLKDGGRVSISDVLIDQGKETTKKFAERFGKDKVHWCPCDVTKEEDWTNLWDSTEKFFGAPVDILVNNAGINHTYGWRKCVDVNLIGVMMGTELAMDRLGRVKGSGRGGHVINIASIAGILKTRSRQSVSYVTSKSGVVALTKSLGAKDVQLEEGVRVNAVCPHFADTHLVTDHKDIMDYVKDLGNDLIPVSQVVDAFMRLVKSNDSGQAVVVLPNNLPFIYYPLKNDLVFFWMAAGAALAKKVLPSTTEFREAHQLAWLAVCFLLFNLALKLVAGILF